uniref:Interleukin-4 n=1 Tax=Piliocolobus tephrosceles TaxID=591936 RepID=A0A8C9GD03_9PRIM
MGLTSQLLPPLFFLLACAGNFVHGHNCHNALREIIKTLNSLTEQKTLCTELTVTDILAASKQHACLPTHSGTTCRPPPACVPSTSTRPQSPERTQLRRKPSAGLRLCSGSSTATMRRTLAAWVRLHSSFTGTSS